MMIKFFIYLIVNTTSSFRLSFFIKIFVFCNVLLLFTLILLPFQRLGSFNKWLYLPPLMKKNLERYSRQLLLSQIGVSGQKKLAQSCAAVIGLGALGSHTADLLARAGIGTLVLVDRDIVELQNLQRQCLYTEKDIGKAKSACAEQHLRSVNHGIKIVSHAVDLDFKNVNHVLAGVDLIVDGTDNLATRFLLNEYSLNHHIPWIYGAVVADHGNVLLVHSHFCFRCLFSETQPLGTCDTIGVLNSAVSVVAGLQVTLALQYLVSGKAIDKLLRFSASNCAISSYLVHRKKNCSCCVQHFYPYLSGRTGEKAIKLCGRGVFQLKGKHVDLQRLKRSLYKILKRSEKIIDWGYALKFRELMIFHDGRVLVHAADEKKARSLYYKYMG